MSNPLQAALRRARVRDLAGDPDAPPAQLDPLQEVSRARELEEIEGPRRQEASPGRQPGRRYKFELSESERAELEQLSSEGYGYARELVRSLDDGYISELGAWNARDALEDDTGKSWPSCIPAKTKLLARKVGALFNEAT